MLSLKNRIKAFLNYPKQEKHDAIKPEVDRLIEQLKNFRRLIYITPYAHNKIAYEISVDSNSLKLIVDSVEFLDENHFEVLNGFSLLLSSDEQFLLKTFESRRSYNFLFPSKKYDYYLEEIIRFSILPRHRILNWKGNCLPEPALDLLREDINNLATLTGSNLSEQLIQDYVKRKGLDNALDNTVQQLEQPNTWIPSELILKARTLNFRQQFESDWPIPEDSEFPSADQETD